MHHHPKRRFTETLCRVRQRKPVPAALHDAIVFELQTVHRYTQE